MSNDAQPVSVPAPLTRYEQRAIATALRAMERVMRRSGPIMSSPRVARDFLTLQLAARDHEVFAVVYLDARNRMIAYEEPFRGTLTQTAVYPREIVKAALLHGAAAVLFAHNHPSGNPEPSAADRTLTQTLKTALATVDVNVLDHIIVAGASTYSFAERGLI